MTAATARSRVAIALVTVAGAIGLCTAGCGKGGGRYDGAWEGEIKERGTTARVRLDLKTDGGELGGTFTIVSGLNPNADVKMGQPFRLAGIRTEADELRFTVVLTGEPNDPDNLLFRLRLGEGRLVGDFRENRGRERWQEIAFDRAR
jgi:hypothetical protein